MSRQRPGAGKGMPVMKVIRTRGRAGLSARMQCFVVNNLQVVCKQRHSQGYGNPGFFLQKPDICLY